MDAFIELFGHINVLTVILFCAAFYFIYKVYKAISNYIIKRHDAEQEKDAQLKEALTETRKYPEYRQQSVKVQEKLESEIQEIRNDVQALMNRFEEIEEQNRKRERSKLRDMLLQNYRHYTNIVQNPSQSWTRMESDAFWELFREYEEAGGDGYMHTVVQPEMDRLTIVDVTIQN